MRKLRWTADIGVLALGLSSLSACNFEVNIHLDGADEREAPAPSVASPQADAEPAAPLPPLPPEPPETDRAPDAETVIRDALWRPEAPRVTLERFVPPADRRRPAGRRGLDFVVAPRLLNGDELAERASESHPPLLRDAGIEGTVEVDVHVTEAGRVGAVELAESSGHLALDEAAVKIAFIQRFEPALADNGHPVAVWVTVPITFQAR